jgi:hypothetical protein
MAPCRWWIRKRGFQIFHSLAPFASNAECLPSFRLGGEEPGMARTVNTGSQGTTLP